MNGRQACDPAPVTERFDPEQSRRHTFPPVWAVPLLVLVAFYVLISLVALAGVGGWALGILALLGGIVAFAWVQRRADAYVRRQDTGS